MDTPLCPEWWPQMLWKLHIPRPKLIDDDGIPPWGPVNYPPAIDHIMSALLIHSSSYLLQDKAVGEQIRKMSVETIVNMAQKMDKLHIEAQKQHVK